MRIAIDARSLMDGRRSGIEEYTVRIVTAMAAVAPQHQYLLFYNSGSPIALPPRLGRYPIVSTAYPNIFFNASQALINWPKWDRLLQADCFFVPSFRLLPVALSMPVVTTVHDLSFERFPEFFSWQRRLWHQLMRPRLLMENSDHLIAVSEATSRDLQELYHIPAERISVVHSGIDPLPVTARNSIASVRKKYQLPPDYLLYFGTLEPRKNIESIIRSFSAIAPRVPHHLVIAGARGWLTKSIDRAIQASPVRDRIHLVGFVQEADKWAMFAAAALFVYPSFYEGFGFPPLEALVSGTPVVTSHNSSLPEIVGKWATLVDPYNPAELAVVLTEMLTRPARVSPAVQQEIAAAYSWREAAAQTVRRIEAVV